MQGADEIGRGRRHQARIAYGLDHLARRPVRAARDLLHLMLGMRGLGSPFLVQHPHRLGFRHHALGSQGIRDGRVEATWNRRMPPGKLQQSGDLLVPCPVPPRSEDPAARGVPLGHEDMQVEFRGRLPGPCFPVPDDNHALGIEAELPGEQPDGLGLLPGRDVVLRRQLEVTDRVWLPRCPRIRDHVVQVLATALEDGDLLVRRSLEDVIIRLGSAFARGHARALQDHLRPLGAIKRFRSARSRSSADIASTTALASASSSGDPPALPSSFASRMA